MTLTPRRARPSSRTAPRHGELLHEIAFLRSLTRDVIEHYSLQIQAALARQERILEAPDTKRGTARKPKKKAAREMISRIRSLRVKPKKGRAKDLARIEKLVNNLAGLMPSQP